MENISLTCGAVAAALIISGTLKIAQPTLFLQYSATLGGPRIIRKGVPAVPWLEFVIGLGLISPMYRSASVIAATLTTLFVVVALRGLKVPAHRCGCFGSLDATTPPWLTLARAVLLSMGAWFCLVESGLRDQRPAFSGVAVGLLVGTGLAASFLLVGQIAAMRRDMRAARTAGS